MLVCVLHIRAPGHKDRAAPVNSRRWSTDMTAYTHMLYLSTLCLFGGWKVDYYPVLFVRMHECACVYNA